MLYMQNTNNNTEALRLPTVAVVLTVKSFLLNHTCPSCSHSHFLCLMYKLGPSLGQGSSLLCLGSAEPKDGWAE